MNFLRWILAAPLTLVVWFAVLVAGGALVGLSERSLPAVHRDTSWWVVLRHLESATVIGLSALPFVFIPAQVVPSGKRECALFALVMGAFLATCLAMTAPTSIWVEYLSALAGGLIGIRVVWSIWSSDDERHDATVEA